MPAGNNKQQINEDSSNEIDTEELIHDCLNAGGEIPSSTKMCIFQLAESNDLDRISKILNYLASDKNSTENILYMI